jgi:beta-aspartyl-dipeptidase (metallo-type)
MVIIIENGEVFTPSRIGQADLLLIDNSIQKIGTLDRDAIDRLDLETEVIDATDCLVVPGFIDPHEHLLGGSGEEGFSSQTPEIFLDEIISAGITTVVGGLGVDTTMKTMPGLLARAKALKEEGLHAYVWTGGYNVPPTTIMKTIRDDIMFIEEVIGAGEIAIADERSTDPTAHELARLANDAYVGGMLSRKAGVTHFHVGKRPERLRILRELIDEFDAPAESLYPTHVERSEELMDEAIELTHRGCFVDIDTVGQDLHKWLTYYLDHGGSPEKITISSDASISSPSNIIDQIRDCTRHSQIEFERLLPMVTSNTARVLQLRHKGNLAPGFDSDVVVLQRDSLEVREVIASGKRLLKNSTWTVQAAGLTESNRTIQLTGDKIKTGDSS